MWFVIIYHSMLAISNAQRFISSLISDTHHGSVHGAGKNATQLPRHQGSVGRRTLAVTSTLAVATVSGKQLTSND